VSGTNFNTIFNSTQGIAGGTYNAANYTNVPAGLPTNTIFVVENIDNTLGDIQIMWPFNRGFEHHYKRRSFNNEYSDWALDYNSESLDISQFLTDVPSLQDITDEGATTDKDITANSFTGDGSALEDVNAFQLDGEDADYYTQTLDVSTLVGTKLNLSLSNNGQITKEIDLNPIITRGISGSSGSAGAGAGVYTITHNLGATATAISCTARGGTFYHIQVTSSSSNSFSVKIFKADGSQETTATNIILDSILTFQ
jgi:hypothetical protein